MTTAGAFLAMTISDFRGFREYGIDADGLATIADDVFNELGPLLEGLSPSVEVDGRATYGYRELVHDDPAFAASERGLRSGRELRSASPSAPSDLKRASHLKPVRLLFQIIPPSNQLSRG